MMPAAQSGAEHARAARGAAPPVSPGRPSRPQRLATASWMCPVLIIALNFALQPVRSDPASRGMATMIFGIAALVLAIVGLGSGLTALASVRRHGRRGILVPAMIGSVISSLYVATFVISYLLATGGP